MWHSVVLSHMMHMSQQSNFDFTVPIFLEGTKYILIHYIYIYIYTYTHTHTHIYIYTYIHTHTQLTLNPCKKKDKGKTNSKRTLFSEAKRLTAGVAWVLRPLISWCMCSSWDMAGISTTSSWGPSTARASETLNNSIQGQVLIQILNTDLDLRLFQCQREVCLQGQWNRHHSRVCEWFHRNGWWWWRMLCHSAPHRCCRTETQCHLLSHTWWWKTDNGDPCW